jgi:hypothetical protein
MTLPLPLCAYLFLTNLRLCYHTQTSLTTLVKKRNQNGLTIVDFSKLLLTYNSCKKQKK